MRREKNYAMVKFNVPKRVTLPNGRTFVARYKRIPRGELPPNIVMRRTYAQRAAPRGRRRKRRQQGQGIFDFVKKVARNPLVKSLAQKGLEYAPGIYQDLTKRVTNKTLKRILNSDAAHLALNKVKQLFTMSKGLIKSIKGTIKLMIFLKMKKMKILRKIIWEHIGLIQ